MTLPRAALASVLAALLLAFAVVAVAPAVRASDGPVGHGDLHVERPSIRDSSKLARLRAKMDRRQQPARVQAMSAAGPMVEREVLGYLPYWEMDYDFPHWELLTVLAWFGADMNASGQITDYNGWGGAATEDLVAEAHAHGVKVIVTVTNFDDDGIAQLLASSSNRAAAIDTCLELMATHGADGINIDFEFVPGSVRDEFVTFMADLKQAVLAAQPNGGPGHVSLAGPAVDWNGAYDYDELLIHTDGIMVMAYGYHWSGGNPGPTSPLYGGGIWGKHSVAWTIDDYLTHGGVENRHKILIGLPFYGRRWPVATEAVPGSSLGSGKAVTFDVAHPQAAQYGATWEDDSKTVYYHRTLEGQLWQYWYDDPAAFGLKLAYIAEKDLGGIGIWALGYDAQVDEYWVELEDHFGAVPEEPTVDDPPDDDPPVEDPPDGDPPTDDPPADDPPADDPPTDDPPADDPPADDPPADDPPADDPPGDDPPADDGTGERGATDGQGGADDGSDLQGDGGERGADDALTPTLSPEEDYTVMRTDSSTQTREMTSDAGCGAGGSGAGWPAAALMFVLWSAAVARRRW